MNFCLFLSLFIAYHHVQARSRAEAVVRAAAAAEQLQQLEIQMEDGEGGGGGGGGDSPPRSGKVYVRAEGKKKNIILSDSI